MASWFEAKRAGGFPSSASRMHKAGCWAFAAGEFRAYPAYKYTVEHSVYVHPQHRGRGLGQQLMELLIAEARQRGDVHVLVGAIDAANAGSIALHKRLGFESVGLMPQVGFKFGRWLDLAFYQLTLQTPLNPVDG
jgi:phosphinothricin acetyltransferase